jgi:hypothetical protein
VRGTKGKSFHGRRGHQRQKGEMAKRPRHNLIPGSSSPARRGENRQAAWHAIRLLGFCFQGRSKEKRGWRAWISVRFSEVSLHASVSSARTTRQFPAAPSRQYERRMGSTAWVSMPTTSRAAGLQPTAEGLLWWNAAPQSTTGLSAAWRVGENPESLRAVSSRRASGLLEPRDARERRLACVLKWMGHGAPPRDPYRSVAGFSSP